MLVDVDTISGDVVDIAVRLHRDLGPGLLESVYETVLAGKLIQRGYRVERQKPVDIIFEGTRFAAAFRVDLLIEQRLIVEIKSVERLSAAHAKQLLTYLRLMKLPVGLLLNFSEATMKAGIRRLVNNHTPSAPLRLCADETDVG